VFKFAKITYIDWPIECIPKPSFERLFKLAKTTYIFWSIEYTPKPSFE
jgi:hypothetical protein